MAHIIQCFKKFGTFKKAEYSTKAREIFSKWRDNLFSSNAFCKEDAVILPENKSHLHLNKDSLVIIEDIFDQSHIERNQFKELPFVKNLKIPVKFDIFKIIKSSDNCYEIFLDYCNNALLIGEPRRDNFKIGDLNLNAPLRISINGKSDFTMSGRKDRTYYEYEYIFVYHGIFHKFEYRKDIKSVKAIPFDSAKHIDLRKILY